MKRILTFLFLFSSLFASSQTQFLGAPNTTIVVKGNMKVDSILYLPKRSKTPTDTGALRYQISDSSLYVWTGNAWRKAKNDGTITSVSAGTGMSFTTITSTGSVSADTNVLSTKAWRQKGDDSLGAIIATKGTVTSVGLTMPSAFAVANSPITTSGTLAVTATGSATEYIRGDGTLGTLPTSGGGGGSGVNYYLNGSVSQGTIGGSTYYEMSKTPIVGTGTNFTAAADGLIQQFITDAGDPNRLLIPAGAWNFELYFSASSAGGTPTFYVELLKYDGTTFTSIASSSASPQAISNGTIKTLYFTSLAVSETVLTATDRLAIRVYVNVSGRTITFYTEDANLAEIITTFAGGVVSLNGLTANDQFFATGTTGSDFNISSTSATHTFNLPTASATNRGALSSANWTTFNNKVNISDTAAMLTNYIRHAGNGLTKTGQALSVDTSAIATRSRVQKGIDSLGAVKQNVLTNPVTGTGTTNYVPKWSGTSTQTISQIFDNGTNVGIGNTSPTNKLHVGGTLKSNGAFTTNTSATINRVGSNGVGGGGLLVFADTSNNPNQALLQLNSDWGIDMWSFTGSWLNAFSVKGNTGNFGIGTQSPSYKLDITGTLRNTTGAAFATSSGNVLVGTTTDGGLYKLDVQGALRNTTGANFATSSGNVGIGTTSSNAKLEIYPGTIAGANRQEVLRIDVPGDSIFSSAEGYINFRGYDLVNIVNQDIAQIAAKLVPNTTGNSRFGGDLLFYTRPVGTSLTPTERMRILSSGNVGIATPSPLFRLQTFGIANFGEGPFVSQSGAAETRYFDQSTGAFLHSPQMMIRKDETVTTPAEMSSSLVLYNRNGTNNTGSKLVFVANESTASTANPVATAAIVSQKVTGSAGNWATGNLKFLVKNSANYVDAMTILSSGNVGIGNTAPSEALHVTGRIRATTIDSTATGMNMLYADATGVIKKAAVPSGGSGTVTSVATGFGLSGGTITTTGTLLVDSASVATRARVQKGIDSVTTLANTKLTGTGISGYFPKWTGATTQDTSQLFQLGRNIGIGTATPTYRIHLPDAGATADQAMIAGMLFGSDGNGVVMSPGATNLTIKGGNTNGSIFSTTIGGAGHWGINTTSLSDATFNVNGSVKIVTIDSTSTARNMLYQDANGVIKKSAVASGVSGSGTTNYLPKWTSGSAIGNSVAYDNGGELLINTTSDAGDYKLQVSGAIYASTTISTGGVNGETSKTWKLGSRRAAAVSLDTTQYLEVEVNGVLYYIAMIQTID